MRLTKKFLILIEGDIVESTLLQAGENSDKEFFDQKYLLMSSQIVIIKNLIVTV